MFSLLIKYKPHDRTSVPKFCREKDTKLPSKERNYVPLISSDTKKFRLKEDLYREMEKAAHGGSRLHRVKGHLEFCPLRYKN